MSMLKRKIIVALIFLVIILGMGAVIFWSRFTPFYQDCMKIHQGMSAAEAERYLAPYINNERYEFSRNTDMGGTGLYVSSKFSGNQCYMEITGGIISAFKPRFEP